MDIGCDPRTLGGAHLGRVEATLLEAIIMLIAMIVAARWVIRRFEVPQTTPATTAIGLVALGVLIPAEIAGVVFVRRLSFQDYFSSFLTAPARCRPIVQMLPNWRRFRQPRGAAYRVIWPLPRRRSRTLGCGLIPNQFLAGGFGLVLLASMVTQEIFACLAGTAWTTSRRWQS